MDQSKNLKARIISLLEDKSLTSTELSRALSSPEETVISALDSLRKDRRIDFMAGDWSIRPAFEK